MSAFIFQMRAVVVVSFVHRIQLGHKCRSVEINFYFNIDEVLTDFVANLSCIRSFSGLNIKSISVWKGFALCI